MKLWDLYDGFQGAYGTYEIRRTDERGKRTGKALTVRKAVTEALWHSHLAGKQGIGIIPLREDNTLKFAAIDVDVYQNLDYQEVERRINTLKLPLVMIKSKSGGLHLMLFLKEPAPADLVVDVISRWASALGFGGSEIFPKQTSRYDDDDLGNWINAAYFDAARTQRPCWHQGKELDLEEFLEFAEGKLATIDEIQAIEIIGKGAKVQVENTGPFEDGPPCLQWLHANGGFPEGTRNEGMSAVAVYLKKRFPEDWESMMVKYAAEMCDPPMKASEVDTISKSNKKKDYAYPCKKHPLMPRCDRRTCIKREYGVGPTAQDGRFPEIENLTKYNSDPPIYVATIKGKRIKMSAEDLGQQQRFKMVCMKQIDVLPPTLSRPRYENYINTKLLDLDIVEPSEDTTELAIFVEHLSDFLSSKAQAKTPVELHNRGIPYRDPETGLIYFKFVNLVEYLQRFRGNNLSNSQVSMRLKEVGADTKHVSWPKVPRMRVWFIEEQMVRPIITNTDTPFKKDDDAPDF